MELKVKLVDGPDVKSAVEVEEELIAEAEQKHEGISLVDEEGETPVVDVADDAEITTEDVTTDTPAEETSISEEDVLSFLKNKYGRDVDSLDEYTAVPESSEDKVDLPEDVQAYLQYKQTTGRGMGDYLKLNRDLESMDGDTLLKEYLLDTETDLDSEDIADLMDEYAFDEDTDTDADVRKAKRAKKKAVAKAKEYFTEQSKMYAEPTESVAASISEEDSEAIAAYKQSVIDAQTAEEANNARSESFTAATDKIFNDDFKGFDFKIGEDTFTFTAGTAAELKEAQSTPMNFIGKYMDESGTVNDAAGYHKALAAAMNPEKFAQFFFEQGQANAKGDVLRTTKNINMSTRTSPEVSTKGGTTVKAVHTSHGRGLKIKSRK